MLESGKESLNGSFRHHQSERLSHRWEPTEFALPIVDGRRIPRTGKGLGLVAVLANDRIEFKSSPSKSAGSHSLISRRTVAKSKTPRPNLPACVAEFDLSTSSRLLDRDEERQLAKQIFRYRQAFQRLVLKEADVLDHLIGLIQQWASGNSRVDSICNMGLSELKKRKKIEPKLRASIRKLEQLSTELRGERLDVKNRSHRKIVEIVEALDPNVSTLD